jgi:hypothetical protein
MKMLHQGGIRHLDFANDGLSLYYSMRQDNSIHHYSVDRTRLLEPVRTNVQPPIAMAISPTGHLMISATKNPPVVLMRNLEHNSAAVVIKTSASEATVSSIAFHPRRPDIFVLTFVDGTLAAYDATKTSKAAAGSAYGDSQGKGEIGRVVGLYNGITASMSVQNEDLPAAPIIGAAFLPGYKTRVVTAGADGRCRIVDLAQGGSILRTWHTKMPITSLDVVEYKAGVTGALDQAGPSSQEHKSVHTGSVKVTPVAGNTLIAVARIDGSVHIYNTLGLLLSRKSVTSYDERILSIAWTKGASPASLNNSNIEKRFSEGSKDLNYKSEPLMAVQHASQDDQGSAGDADEGTTRIHSSPVTTKPTLPPLTRANFQDLFSPIKPQSPPRVVVTRISKGSSPRRYRPGLSNQTFVQSPPPDSEASTNAAPPRNLALFPSSESDIYVTAPSQQPQSDISDQTSSMAPSRHPDAFGLPLIAKKRQVAFKAATPRRQVSGFSYGAIPPPNTNARVLADLRKLASANSSASRQTGTLSSFASAQQRLKPPISLSKANADSSSVTRLKSANPPSTRKRRSAHLHDSSTWPTDSVSAPSLDDGKVEDIWLTSEAEEAEPQPARRRGHRGKRISKSSTLFPEDFDSGIGYSESGVVPQSASTHQDHANLRFTDLTFSDHEASQDHINEVRPVASRTPLLGEQVGDEDKAPISDAVRRLFPRSSSRSPRRTRQNTTALTHLAPQPLSDTAAAKSSSASRSRRKDNAAATLMSLAVRSAEQQQQRAKKNPDKRAASQNPQRTQRGSRSQAPQRNNFTEPTNTDRDATSIGNDPSPHQFSTQNTSSHNDDDDDDEDHSVTNHPSTTTNSRVASLENEVLALKAEVLALKALLRRHGIPASQVEAVTAMSREKTPSGWTCLRG